MDKKGLIAVVVGLAGLLWTGSLGYCQPTPKDLGMFTFGVGGRVVGMGGAYVAVADDGLAAYYNPAGLVQISGKFSIPFSVGARVFNVEDVVKIYDLKDLLDKVEDRTFSPATDWPKLKDIVIKAEQKPLGGDCLATHFGWAFPGFAVTGFGIAKAEATLKPLGNFYTATFGPGVIENLVDTNAGAYAVSGTAFSFAFPAKPDAALGLSLKLLKGYYYPYKYNIIWDGISGAVTHTPFDGAQASAEAQTIDVGYMRFLPDGKTTFGLVIKDINSPELRFADALGKGRDASLSLERVVNMGIAHRPDPNLLIAFDWDNVTLAYGRPWIFNGGIEYKTGNFAARCGVHDGTFVKGFGLKVWLFNLDVTLGPNHKNYVSISTGASW